ncbi:hypothetical protein L6164_030415 [Bauhinia variegata]|uniref:Uncharacterized protein n=1 Tax=Bauhinia variegata TaxID=167791 RepID=A0ACB9LCB2_BAUVA|nr:hypothetical protein L6164_030415 [Bauhinia variegata]
MTMESPIPQWYVVIACDATKDRTEHDAKVIVERIRSTDGILNANDKLLVLGILHRVPHPMGYQTLACPESFSGTNFREMEEEVNKKVEAYASVLLPRREDYENAGA